AAARTEASSERAPSSSAERPSFVALPSFVAQPSFEAQPSFAEPPSSSFVALLPFEERRSSFEEPQQPGRLRPEPRQLARPQVAPASWGRLALRHKAPLANRESSARSVASASRSGSGSRET